MAYTVTDWVDGVTPVNAANLDKLEAGVAAAAAAADSANAAIASGVVPLDGAVPAATRILTNELLVAHTQPAFRIMGDGKIEWGGGTLAPDVNLYRASSGTYLVTGNSFRLIEGAEAQPRVQLTKDVVGSGGGIGFGAGGATAQDVLFYRAGVGLLRMEISQLQFGSAGDTNLYRSAANTLKTDDLLVALLGFSATGSTAGVNALLASVLGDTQPRLQITNLGELTWGPGNAAVDTMLGRYAANVLGTDDGFNVGLDLTVASLGAGRIKVGGVGPSSAAGFLFGSSDDVNLYRSAANELKTDDTFVVGGTVQSVDDILIRAGTAGYVRLGAVAPNGTDAGIKFGSAGDVNLYRQGADVLRTDDTFVTPSNIAAGTGTTYEVQLGWYSGGIAAITFGNDNTARIIRGGAGNLQTPADFVVGKTLALGQALSANGWAMYTHSVGESSFRFILSNLGNFQWGDGGGSVDTTLYRSAAGVLKSDGRIESANAQEIPLQNPRVSTLAGNSFFTVKAMTNYDWGHWEFLKDVDGYSYGRVRVEGARAAPSVVISIAAAATAGVTRLALDYAKLSDGQTMDQGFSSLAAQDITVPGTSQARKDVTFGPLAAFAHGDFLIVRVYHAGAHANDTLAVNTMLAGAWLIG